jgi:hypothetical protein
LIIKLRQAADRRQRFRSNERNRMLESRINPRSLGVEIEAVCAFLGLGGNAEVQESLASVLRANGISAKSRQYGHAPVETDVAVETDGSLHFEDCPYQGVRVASLEVKTRILNGVEDFSRVLPKTLEIMRFAGARVNASTGMHVHISIPEISNDPRIIRSIYNLVRKYQYVLFGLCPKSRLTSRYCQPLPDAPVAMAGCRTMRCFRRALGHLDRYHIVNFTHLWEETPRLEFRLFGSTLNPVKAVNHVRLVCGLIDHACRRSVQSVAQPLPNDRRSLESMLVSCGFKVNSGIYSTVSPEMRETGRWLLQRWFDLNGRVALKPKADNSGEGSSSADAE